MLGHRVSAKGTLPDPGKVAAIMDRPRPTTITEVRAFNDAVGFFKKYIKEFEKIATPLYEMTSNKGTNCWTEERDEAWKELRQKLVEAPIL